MGRRVGGGVDTVPRGTLLQVTLSQRGRVWHDSQSRLVAPSPTHQDPRVMDGGTVSSRRVTPDPSALPGPRMSLTHRGGHGHQQGPSQGPAAPGAAGPHPGAGRGVPAQRCPGQGRRLRGGTETGAAPVAGPGAARCRCRAAVPSVTASPGAARCRRRPAVTPQPGGARLLPGVQPPI